MKSLLQRLLVSTAVAIVSLSHAGSAMAASPHHKAQAPAAHAAYGYQASRYQALPDVAAIAPYPSYSSGTSPGPRSLAGYDNAARPPFSQSGYPAAQWGYPVAGPGMDVGQLIAGLFGGAVPLHYGGRHAVSSSGSDYVDTSPPPDTSASDAVGAAAEQNALDASAAAIQQEDANLQALDQSISAMEQQMNGN
jgi:hypothetical protein